MITIKPLRPATIAATRQFSRRPPSSLMLHWPFRRRSLSPSTIPSQKSDYRWPRGRLPLPLITALPIFPRRIPSILSALPGLPLSFRACDLHHFLLMIRQPEYVHVLLNPIPVYGMVAGGRVSSGTSPKV